MPTEPIKLTQPDDWVAAWKAQAAAEGKTLSEWTGENNNAALPKKVARKLSQRPPAHRPKKQGSE